MEKKYKIITWLTGWIALGIFFFLKYANEYRLCIDFIDKPGICKLGYTEGIIALIIVSIIYNVIIFGIKYIITKIKK